MNPIDFAVIAIYIAGCTSLGAWLGSRSQGLKGYFLGESNIPTWAVMISIVATETSTVDVPERPRPGLQGRAGTSRFLQLAFGYLLGPDGGRDRPACPPISSGSIFTAYQLLQGRFGGPTRSTASILFLVARSLGDGLRLVPRRHGPPNSSPAGRSRRPSSRSRSITVIYTFLGGMKAVDLDRRHPVRRLHPGGDRGRSDDPGRASSQAAGPSLIETAQTAGKFRLLELLVQILRSQNYTFWAGLIGGMVLNTATHGVDQIDGPALSGGPVAAPGRHVALIASGFVVLAQFSLFLLIGVSLWVFYGVFRSRAGDVGFEECRRGQIRRGLQRTSSSITSCRTGVIGLLVASALLLGDGDPRRLAQRLGLDDRQRPDTARLHRLDRRSPALGPRSPEVMTVVWGCRADGRRLRGPGPPRRTMWWT